MNLATISSLPEFRGDGYNWGGGYVVNCPIIYLGKSAERLVSPNSVSLIISGCKASESECGDETTARFITEAINEKIHRDLL